MVEGSSQSPNPYGNGRNRPSRGRCFPPALDLFWRIARRRHCWRHDDGSSVELSCTTTRARSSEVAVCVLLTFTARRLEYRTRLTLPCPLSFHRNGRSAERRLPRTLLAGIRSSEY